MVERDAGNVYNWGNTPFYEEHFMIRTSLTRWSLVAAVSLSVFATAHAQSRHAVHLTGPMRVGTSVVTEHADFINKYYTGTTPQRKLHLLYKKIVPQMIIWPAIWR